MLLSPPAITDCEGQFGGTDRDCGYGAGQNTKPRRKCQPPPAAPPMQPGSPATRASGALACNFFLHDTVHNNVKSLTVSIKIQSGLQLRVWTNHRYLPVIEGHRLCPTHAIANHCSGRALPC